MKSEVFAACRLLMHWRSQMEKWSPLHIAVMTFLTEESYVQSAGVVSGGVIYVANVL